jgi:hypothetical protein
MAYRVPGSLARAEEAVWLHLNRSKYIGQISCAIRMTKRNEEM